MKEIRVLDKNTIDKIAAGEVVERPSSVVKELMENAIDAGSTALSVEIRDGGISLIRVTDNGSGIDRSQIRNAFLRHSTSKISDASDLAFLRTLGFRGEALSSISAVSRLELCTKTKDSLTGSIYKIEGGEEVSFTEAGLPDGTTILVRDLFYNTPARLKFLKSPQTEAGHVSSIVSQIALSHPEIAVKYTVNGSVKLNTKGNGALKDAVYSVYGRDITNALIEVDAQDDLLRIRGFIGEPAVARSSRALENYYINGRYIKDKVIASAIEEAYKGYQMKGTFPFTDLYITIEPELTDVNVHPSKMEIRFFDNEKVFASISRLLRYALTERERIPSVSLEEKESEKAETIRAAEPFETRRSEREAAETPAPVTEEETARFLEMASLGTAGKKPADAFPGGRTSGNHAQNGPYHGPEEGLSAADNAASQTAAREETSYEQTTSEQILYDQTAPEQPSYEQTSLFNDAFLSKEGRLRHRLVGEVFATYWIVEYGDEMYLIDQHAAHEKILYERFVAQMKNGEHFSQQLSPALIVTLSPAEEEALHKFLPVLEKLGFQAEPFGGNEYALSAVPADLYTLNDRELFLSFLDEAADFSGNLTSEMLEDRIATAACKAAVKGGNRLSTVEANAMIDELLSLENPYNCPHGRPAIIRMSRKELEKKFKRIL